MQKGDITINTKTYSLQELMQSVQSVLQKAYAARFFWVRCEVARISLHAQSGHCYLELIDKNDSSIVALQKGIIWVDNYETICEKFRAVTNLSLAAGMKVLFYCGVNFHAVHGMSIVITDIEPSFTLGEMARMKNETIARLKSTGLFNRNRQKQFPAIPQRIAVISVITSRGYQDFISTIENHPSGFRIMTFLFEAILQGENAVVSLTRALEKIFSRKNEFDAIAIIRGGAGDSGLACYDEYALASFIAQSPLPVITGIGHASNETVTEMIAAVNCITPTAAATFLITKFEEQALIISHHAARLGKLMNEYFSTHKLRLTIDAKKFYSATQSELGIKKFGLQRLVAAIPSELNGRINTKKYELSGLTRKFSFLVKQCSSKNANMINAEINIIRQSLKNLFSNNHLNIQNAGKLLLSSRNIISNKSEALLHLRDMISLLDPVNTLKRGYSITRINGNVVKSLNDVNKGTVTETELHDGIFISNVESKKKNGKEEKL